MHEYVDKLIEVIIACLERQLDLISWTCIWPTGDSAWPLTSHEGSYKVRGRGGHISSASVTNISNTNACICATASANVDAVGNPKLMRSMQSNTTDNGPN